MINIHRSYADNHFLQDNQGQGHWMDGRAWNIVDFPITKSLLLPLHDRYRSEICVEKSEQQETEENNSVCSALVVHNGLSAYTITQIKCDIPHTVTLYCEHKNNEVNVSYDNELSDIKIQQNPGNLFHIQYSQSCEDGWFRVGNYCMNLFACLNRSDEQLVDTFCQAYDAKLANDVIKSSVIIDEDGLPRIMTKSQLALFWSMFLLKQVKYQEVYSVHGIMHNKIKSYYRTLHININSSDVCIQNQTACNMTDLYLTVKVHAQEHKQVFEMKKEKFMEHNRSTIALSSRVNLQRIISSREQIIHIRGALWSFMQTPYLTEKTISNQNKASYTICEKPLYRKDAVASCSQLYLTCDDGTCIHDSLVCDGHLHCLYGEDEKNCQAMCNDDSIDCITQCHYDNKCICSDNFFQCLSGGCIPLHNLCDQTVHCNDGSDEPTTCVYIRPEDLQSELVTLQVSNHVNTLIKRVNVMNIDCLKHLKRRVQQEVDYNMHYNSPHCQPNNSPSGLLVPCTDWTLYTTNEQFIPLSNLCIYDTICHPLSYCRNGFHLLNCDHTFCNGKFKCFQSYCIPLSHVCNNVCDCPCCEEEKFCERLFCPGLLLIPQKPTGLSCTDHVQHDKYNVYRRLLVLQPLLEINDDFPVYVRIYEKSRFSDMINKPEIITYLKINRVRNLMEDISELFDRMFSVRTLDISQNNIVNLEATFFISMINIELINISHNLLRSLPKSLLCSNEKLKYLLINNNLIVKIPSSIFSEKLQLKQIMMENNFLNPLDSELRGPFPSLDHLSSDLPRFCCYFDDAKTCSPSFPTFMSCRQMITSKLQVAIAWCAGILTTCLNLVCLCITINAIVQATNISKRALIAIVISINISMAELLSSLCLLSYSIFNVMYSGYFGITVDKWRHSVKCLLLESIFSVSAQSSLAFGVLITIHFAVYIPSIVRQEIHKRRTVLIIMLIWLGIILICTTGQIVQRNGEIDEYNYFCFPFVTSQLQGGLQISFHSSLLFIDFLSVCLCISLNVYIFVFVIRQSRTKLSTSAVQQERLRKFAVRMAILILTSTISWIPILILQIIALIGYPVTPAAFLWTLIISFCFNLILDPILVMQNAMKVESSFGKK